MGSVLFFQWVAQCSHHAPRPWQYMADTSALAGQRLMEHNMQAHNMTAKEAKRAIHVIPSATEVKVNDS